MTGPFAFTTLLVLACGGDDPDLADQDGDGFSPAAGDCDDLDGLSNPVAPELCDGVDNDCDARVDEGRDAVGVVAWFKDSDEDGYGASGDQVFRCAPPDGYVVNGADCNDDDPAIHPDAAELCDGRDEDCDGVPDNDAVDAPTWYIDDDEDGYGSDDYTFAACLQPDGYLADDTDCDDLHGNVYPGADELCDGLDNDCDGVTDPDDSLDAERHYEDLDLDGYGDVATELIQCEAPAGTTTDARDCDDTDAAVNPAAEEVCDGIDNDCNGLADLDDPDVTDSAQWHADLDGDSYGDPVLSTVSCSQPTDYVSDNTDCDDSNSAVHPDAVEVCGDGVDNDCLAEAEGCLSGTVDLSDADAKAWGGSANGSAGFALDNAGDVDGDGVDDVIIGAWETDTLSSSQVGKAYVLYGPLTSGSLASADRTLEGASQNNYAGRSVAGLGDLDGDGYDDVAIGADGKDEDLVDQDLGIVYVLYGPITADMALNDAAVSFMGDAPGDFAGYALDAAGDVNADGFPDLVVGAYGSDGSGSSAGAVTLLYGPLTGNQALSEAGYTLNGESSGDDAGIAVAGVGDVDGDGYDDVLVGAPDNDAAGGDSGAVYVVLGPVDGPGDLVDAAVTLTGVSSSDDAGTSVDGAGDTNADGYADFLVGVPDNDVRASNSGAAFLVLGPVTTSGDLTIANAAMLGENGSDDLGTMVDGAGDVNNDGFDDLSVSAPNHDAGGTTSGAAYLFFGPLSGTIGAEDAPLKLVGESASDGAGGAAGLGDQDGDGYPELLVGSPGDDDGGTDAGAVYLILGGEGL